MCGLLGREGHFIFEEIEAQMGGMQCKGSCVSDMGFVRWS